MASLFDDGSVGENLRVVNSFLMTLKLMFQGKFLGADGASVVARFAVDRDLGCKAIVTISWFSNAKLLD